MKSEEHYLLGDDDRAAERLRLLAELFEPSLTHFVTGFAPPGVRAVVDLGAGPGHTTRILARLFPAAACIGVDNSARFVDIARQLDSKNDYVVHDASRPLPVAAQDIVFTRFLLTHFAEPQAALSRWANALAPGGRILVQEPALLESENPILTRYYALLAELHRAHGQALYIGRELDRCVDSALYSVVHFARRDFDLPASKMARLHALNLPNWRTDSVAKSVFDQKELDELERGLS